MNIRNFTPENFTPEMLNMTRAQYLVWSVSAAEAPHLNDEDFLLWHREVMDGAHKWGTTDQWEAVNARLRALSA